MNPTQPKINLAVKSQLAKLLATENITVRNSVEANTAMFDIDKRVLTLPVWNMASEDVYDLMVAKEVGIALHSPAATTIDAVAKTEQPDNPSNFLAFIRTIEEIRAERKMKEQYPGLRKSFFNGYKELIEKDFFDLAAVDMNNLHLADRINLYAKAGQYGLMNIPFTESEMDIVNDAMNASSFEDTVNICRRIYTHREMPDDNNGEGDGESPEGMEGDENRGQGRGQGPTQDNEGKNNQGNDSSDDQDSSENGNDGLGKNSPQGSQNNQNDGGASGGNKASSSPMPQSPMLQQKMEDKMKNFVASDKKDYTNKYEYRVLPKMDVNKFVHPYETIYSNLKRELNANNPDYMGRRIYDIVISRNKNYVSSLVQQFEQKMAADEARRVKVSRTGRLDMRKISEYRFNDAIFVKNTILPNGKNHGMLMIVDWSSSMGNCIAQTVEQIIVLCSFCQKMKIPFEVYAFTNHVPSSVKESDYDRRAEALSIYDCGFYHFLSSQMSNREFEENASMLLALVATMGYSCKDWLGESIGESIIRLPSCYTQYGLSGTPLNEATYFSIDLVNAFKAKHNLEIVNTFILSDGEGGSVVSAPQGGHTYTHRFGNVILNLPNNQQFCLFQQKERWGHFNSSEEQLGLVELAKKLTGANYFSIYLSNDNYTPSWADPVTDARIINERATSWKDNNFFTYTTKRGYHENFVIKSTTKVENLDLSNLNDNAKLVTIQKAFIKGAAKRGASRVFLARFSDVIARKMLA
jgi:hypothetical protein